MGENAGHPLIEKALTSKVPIAQLIGFRVEETGNGRATITWTVPALQLTRSEVARLIVNTCLRVGHVALRRGTRYRADNW